MEKSFVFSSSEVKAICIPAYDAQFSLWGHLGDCFLFRGGDSAAFSSDTRFSIEIDQNISYMFRIFQSLNDGSEFVSHSVHKKLAR